jgi:hypothetical protein
VITPRDNSVRRSVVDITMFPTDSMTASDLALPTLGALQGAATDTDRRSPRLYPRPASGDHEGQFGRSMERPPVTKITTRTARGLRQGSRERRRRNHGGSSRQKSNERQVKSKLGRKPIFLRRAFSQRMSGRVERGRKSDLAVAAKIPVSLKPATQMSRALLLRHLRGP